MTADSILKELHDSFSSDRIMSPDWFIQKATELNDALGDEANKLMDLKTRVANLKLGFLTGISEGNVSDAKVRVEASPEYNEMGKQDAKCKQIIEFVRLAKIRSRLGIDEYRGN